MPIILAWQTGGPGVMLAWGLNRTVSCRFSQVYFKNLGRDWCKKTFYMNLWPPHVYILPYTHKYAFFTTYTFQSNLSGCRGVNTVEHVAISFMFVHFGADDFFLKKKRKEKVLTCSLRKSFTTGPHLQLQWFCLCSLTDAEKSTLVWAKVLVTTKLTLNFCSGCRI